MTAARPARAPRGGGVASGASRRPTRRFERELSRAGELVVASVDEVGRGSLAGPVSVGVVVVSFEGRVPSGLRDSKLLAPHRRERLVPAIRSWAQACAVGHAGADEIDAVGIVAALRLAGRRAMAQILAAGIAPDVVLLDGSHDWYSQPPDLFVGLEADDGVGPGLANDGVGPGLVGGWEPRVVTRVKADLTCSGVAAASILAKVERDSIMVELHESDPRYAWDANKGYASGDHLAALAAHGPSEWHRRSWRLPARGVGAEGGTQAGLWTGREAAFPEASGTGAPGEA